MRLEPSGFSGLLGRYANRIAGGDFMIDSVRYQLSCNESPNGHPGHLHGGVKGFDRVIWKAMPVNCSDTLGIVFFRCSLTERRDILVIWTVKSLITGLRTILGV